MTDRTPLRRSLLLASLLLSTACSDATTREFLPPVSDAGASADALAPAPARPGADAAGSVDPAPVRDSGASGAEDASLGQDASGGEPVPDAAQPGVDGCSADLETDPDHCGACGRACAGVDNGARTCVAGECVLECDDGFADCDDDYSTGCEANLTESDNCGECGNECANGQLCAEGACVDECPPATPTQCGTACVDETADPLHCGGCNAPCPQRDNATRTCGEGSCHFVCRDGFDDCNGDPADGCETSLRTIADCGRCDNSCLPDNAIGRCSGEVCEIASCSDGFMDCNGDFSDGCEIDIRTTTNCGACGNRCTVANGVPGCSEGSCVIASCNTGYGSCDENSATGCESLLQTYYRDEDEDGYGQSSNTALFCPGAAPSGWAEVGGDCDDTDAAVHPGATEVCNGIDDDCSGFPDDAFECVLSAERTCTECGYSGGQTCVAGCSWSACSGFTVSRTYTNTAEAFSHDCGRECEPNWCANELDTVAPGCDIVSGGPNLTVPPGRYEVEFYFGDTGTFDFFVYDGGELVGEELGFSNESGTFPRVRVPFEIASGCGDVTVRLFGHTGARIRLYSVTIERVGD